MPGPSCSTILQFPRPLRDFSCITPPTGSSLGVLEANFLYMLQLAFTLMLLRYV